MEITYITCIILTAHPECTSIFSMNFMSTFHVILHMYSISMCVCVGGGKELINKKVKEKSKEQKSDAGL